MNSTFYHDGYRDGALSLKDPNAKPSPPSVCNPLHQCYASEYWEGFRQALRIKLSEFR
jgi:hypothetical protein